MKIVRITLYAALLFSVNVFCSETPPTEPGYEAVRIDATLTQEIPLVRKKSYDATRDAWTGGIVATGLWTLDNYGNDYGDKVCAIGSDQKAVDRWSTVADEVIRLDEQLTLKKEPNMDDVIRVMTMKSLADKRKQQLLDALTGKGLNLSEDRMMKLNYAPVMLKGEVDNTELVLDPVKKETVKQVVAQFVAKSLELSEEDARKKRYAKIRARFSQSEDEVKVSTLMDLNNLNATDLAGLFPESVHVQAAQPIKQGNSRTNKHKNRNKYKK